MANEMGPMGRMSQEIKEMPGEVADFAKRVPGMIASLPGRMAAGYRQGVGQGPQGTQLTRDYWSGALSDMAAVALGSPAHGHKQNVMARHQAMQQRMKEQQAMKKYREGIVQAALLNAKKPRGSQWTPQMKNAVAMGYEPGTPEFEEAVRKLSMKPGVLVDMGDKVGTEFYKGIVERIPKAKVEALNAQQDLARFEVMEQMLPYVGQTGVGKEFMTSFRSMLNQFGLTGVDNALRSLGQATGIDFISGEQGPAEILKAMQGADIIGNASELYPVSNKDIDLLRQMSAGLSVSDPEAQRLLIQQGRSAAQIPIQMFNEYRGYLENAPDDVRNVLPPINPLPEVPWMDASGVINNDRGGMSDEEYDRQMEEIFGPNWRDEP